MITGRSRFNLYLVCLLVASVCGCQTAEKKAEKKKDKQYATLRVHLEVIPNAMDESTTVPIFRAKPVLVTVDKDPFLTEANVSEAKVVDDNGGFDLQIQFDRRGTWLLEEFTTTNPGRHFAIFSEFGDKKRQGRWLGAPIIQGRISSGMLTFTPDASREEADQIALGLNNIAKKIAKKSKW